MTVFIIRYTTTSCKCRTSISMFSFLTTLVQKCPPFVILYAQVCPCNFPTIWIHLLRCSAPEKFHQIFIHTPIYLHKCVSPAPTDTDVGARLQIHTKKTVCSCQLWTCTIVKCLAERRVEKKCQYYWCSIDMPFICNVRRRNDWHWVSPYSYL